MQHLDIDLDPGTRHQIKSAEGARHPPGWVIDRVSQALAWAASTSPPAGEKIWKEKIDFFNGQLKNRRRTEQGAWIAEILAVIVKDFKAVIKEIKSSGYKNSNIDDAYYDFIDVETVMEEFEHLEYLSDSWFIKSKSNELSRKKILPKLVRESFFPNEEARLAFGWMACDFCCNDARKAIDRIGSRRTGISHSCDVHSPIGAGKHSRARSEVTESARRIVQNDGFAGEDWPNHWRKMIEARVKSAMARIFDPDQVLQVIDELSELGPAESVSIWRAFSQQDRDREVREMFRTTPKESILELSAALARSSVPAWASLVPAWLYARHIALKELYALDPGPKKTAVQQKHADCVARAVMLVIKEGCGINEAARRTGLDKSVVSRNVKREKMKAAHCSSTSSS